MKGAAVCDSITSSNEQLRAVRGAFYEMKCPKGEEKAFSAKRIDVAVAPLPSPLCGFARFARYPAFSCRLGAKRARPASRILGPHVLGAFYETKCQGRRKGVFCKTNASQVGLRWGASADSEVYR